MERKRSRTSIKFVAVGPRLKPEIDYDEAETIVNNIDSKALAWNSIHFGVSSNRLNFRGIKEIG